MQADYAVHDIISKVLVPLRQQAQHCCVYCGEPAVPEKVMLERGVGMPLHNTCRDKLLAELSIANLSPTLQPTGNIRTAYRAAIDQTARMVHGAEQSILQAYITRMFHGMQLPWKPGVETLIDYTVSCEQDPQSATLNLKLNLVTIPVCLFCQASRCLKPIPFFSMYEPNEQIEPLTPLVEEQLYILRPTQLFYHQGCAKQFIKTVTEGGCYAE